MHASVCWCMWVYGACQERIENTKEKQEIDAKHSNEDQCSVSVEQHGAFIHPEH